MANPLQGLPSTSSAFELNCDNEAGKGDHRHFAGKESMYAFSALEKLIADFQRDIARWNREDSHS